jgi:hypothetical protein
MTKFGVFIIESLRGDDYFDGKTLAEILNLSHIPVTYKWADTKENLIIQLKLFKKSNMRYLHLSCHADEQGIEINSDFISNKELQDMFDGILNKRRIFMSACKGANRDLATRVIMANGAYSLIGTPINLRFDKSALFWPAFTIQ